MLFSLIPESGESVGNSSLREKVKALVAQQNDELNDQDYWLLRDSLIDEGLIVQGRGYIVFDDPADYDTFDIVCSAKLNEPDPYDVDSFIRTQLSADAQGQLRELLV